MSESNGNQSREAGPRVNDRRRVRLDEEGNPVAVESSAEPQVDAAAESEASLPPEVSSHIATLERDLETARRRVDELARAYQSLDRDREEFKQRLQRERDRMVDVEKGNAATVVLEAIDELDRCLGASGQDDSPLAKGIRLIRDGLLHKVQSQGVQRIDVVGKPYDPNTAEAYDMEITPNEDDDQRVLEEARAGYRYKDRVLRPARVKVAKYVPPAQA